MSFWTIKKKPVKKSTKKPVKKLKKNPYSAFDLGAQIKKRKTERQKTIKNIFNE